MFKKPRRNRVYGTITHIEEEAGLCTWTHKGEVPNYITIKLDERNGQVQSVKTYEKKIQLINSQ